MSRNEMYADALLERIEELERQITAYQIRVDNDAQRYNINEAALVNEYGGESEFIPVLEVYWMYLLFVAIIMAIVAYGILGYSLLRVCVLKKRRGL